MHKKKFLIISFLAFFTQTAEARISHTVGILGSAVYAGYVLLRSESQNKEIKELLRTDADAVLDTVIETAQKLKSDKSGVADITKGAEQVLKGAQKIAEDLTKPAD